MTNQIEITNLQKHYGAFHALRNVNLSIPKGAFVALVGPSGCGKSTLLRSIAGLETVTSGTLAIEGQVVNDLPPRKRDVAMVFQSYALYPHMSVAENLTYSMRLKGVPKAEAMARAREVAEVTGLTELLNRRPRELSGGQRQRVAMGRAIVREPKAFLFDEPLSNLDAALRVHMRAEIRALHDRLGATSVYVTHDQIEAMTMADHVVVMRAGVIEQQGAPLELYDHPANLFVARFIGSPAMNVLAGTVAQDGVTVALEIAEGAAVRLARPLEPGRRVLVGLRPEHLRIDAENPQLRLPIRAVETTGATTYYTTATDPEVMVVIQGRGDLKAGAVAGLSIDPALVHVFDHDTELAL